MAQQLSILQNSFSTIFMQIQRQETPTSALVPYDLSATTATFVAAQDRSITPVISKVSTDITQIVYTNSSSGELEVYLSNVDTQLLPVGGYYYTLYITDITGKQYAVANDKFKLVDTVEKT